MVAGASALGVALQFVADARAHGAGQALALMSGFFTLWTNALAALLLGRVALTGRGAGWAPGFVAVQLLVVAAVYHLVLARLYDPQGVAFVADILLHTVAPAGAVVAWWRHGRGGARWRDAALWLLWPLGFCAAAMARGAATGWYPYFFLDPGVMSWPGVAASVAGLAALFFGLGLLVVAVSRRNR